MSPEPALTEALARLGWTHRESTDHGRRTITDADGEVIMNQTATEGWRLVRDETARREGGAL